MATKYDYLPPGENELAAWFENFAGKLPEHTAALGVSAAEVQQVEDDSDAVRRIVAGGESLKTSASEFVNYKRIVLNGAANDKTPVFPVITSPTAPANPKAGIRERTRAFVRRLKTAAGYDESIGADLGILPVKGETDSPDEAKPLIKVKALPESALEISFVRGKSSGISLDIQRGDDATWTKLGNFVQSPAAVTVTPTTAGAPEKVRLRARYLRGNTPIGQFSDTVNVVTEP